MTPAVEVRDLHKSFRTAAGWRGALGGGGVSRRVLNGISFSIAPGEVFGLLGPNGAGKTTLIKVLCGLVLPDSGSASVLGFDVASQNLEVRRRIGIVHGDERSFFWRLSARENLRFYASLYGLNGRRADRRIDELLRVVGLSDAADGRLYAFSSGMRQRAAIARGLVHDPSVIILDEPTRSLDPVGADDFHQLVQERVATDGRTVLIATHLMNEAEALCDRMTLIEAGETALTGTVDDFRRWVADDVVYEIVVDGIATGWEDEARRMPGVVELLAETRDEGQTWLRLTMRRGSAALPLVIRFLVERRADVRSCTKLEASLEDTFRAIVRERQADVVEAAR